MANTSFTQMPKAEEREGALETFFNDRLDQIDQMTGGYLTISLAGLSGSTIGGIANAIALTPTQARHPRLKFTGNPSATLTLLIPSTTGALAHIEFVNACGGGNSTFLVKSAGANAGNAAGVSIATGFSRQVSHDGESAYYAGGAVVPSTGGASIDEASITGTAWTAFTPTVTSGTGTLTSAAGQGYYRQLGKSVFVRVRATITTNGTGGGWVNITLPVTSRNAESQTLHGKEAGVTGKMLVGAIGANTAVVACLYYDATYPGASGAILLMQGVYEAA